MGYQGGGWYAFLSQDQESKPQVTWELLRRVGQFAWPYRFRVLLLFITILSITGLTLLNPLILRNLIDYAIPEGDLVRLNLLAIGLFAIPIANGLIGVVQRYLSSSIGEGVIFDLRRAL